MILKMCWNDSLQINALNLMIAYFFHPIYASLFVSWSLNFTVLAAARSCCQQLEAPHVNAPLGTGMHGITKG